MTSMGELVGSTREVTIGEKSLKLRQLKIKELFAYFENKSTNTKIEDAKKISDTLGGEEKLAFMKMVWSSLPKGEDLTQLATEAMTTLDGVCDMLCMSAKDLNPDLTEDQIRDLIGIDNIGDIGDIVTWMTGLEGLIDDDSGELEEPEENPDKKK